MCSLNIITSPIQLTWKSMNTSYLILVNSKFNNCFKQNEKKKNVYWFELKKMGLILRHHNALFILWLNQNHFHFVVLLIFKRVLIRDAENALYYFCDQVISLLYYFVFIPQLRSHSKGKIIICMYIWKQQYLIWKRDNILEIFYHSVWRKTWI